MSLRQSKGGRPTRQEIPTKRALDLLRAGPPKFDRRLGPLVPFVLGIALLALDAVLIWRLQPYIWQGAALALIGCSLLAAIVLLIYGVLAHRMVSLRGAEDDWYRLLERVESATRLQEQRQQVIAERAVERYTEAREARVSAEDDAQ